MARNEMHARGSGARSGVASLQWVLVVVAVALVGTVTTAMRHRSSMIQAAAEAASAEAATASQVDPTPTTGGPTPVPLEVMNNLTSIPSETWRKVGTGGGRLPVLVSDQASASSKPVVLYVGAGYCPYCAASRWALITALSRFGTFSGLTYSASSSVDVFPRTPTFSFYGAQYASRYIELQTVELAGDEPGFDGRYTPLQQPTAEQEALLQKYDAPPYVSPQGAGGIPFLLMGGKYLWTGAPFNPQVLANKTQADIAATLPDASSLAAQTILVSANIFTAVVCAVDGNQPAEVCSDPFIQRAIEALPKRIPTG